MDKPTSFDTISTLSSRPPSIESLLSAAEAGGLVEAFGRQPTVDALRAEVSLLRQRLQSGLETQSDPERLIRAAEKRLAADRRSPLRPVLNLTGTVLHTNLGRAPLPEEAVAAVSAIARGASNLEFDLDPGIRGDRDEILEAWLARLTGAEAATVVNNNAAAVLLILNTLALRRDVVISRGELIEIGDSFRLPDIMSRAGAKLREVGTTNRTHLRDYADALSPRTGLILRVHPSNYRIEGFTAQVADAGLASLAAKHAIPYAVDLGSGSMVDLSRFGLPREATPRDAITAGADLVCFSGDKLLGGPQAGLIVGRRDLVRKLKRNPLKRALRCDKMTIAALSAVLPLHADADLVAKRLPAIALLVRPQEEIAAQAERVAPALREVVGGTATVEVCLCRSQIGSGALPCDTLPSAGLRLSSVTRRGALPAGRLAAILRRLPIPVIGRLDSGSIVLDLRCLMDEAAFLAQLPQLRTLLSEGA